MGGGDSGRTVRMCFMPLTCPLKMAKIINLMLGMFYHNKKNG